ncbi:MAG: putative secreted protein [Pseudomonadota bacterium]
MLIHGKEIIKLDQTSAMHRTNNFGVRFLGLKKLSTKKAYRKIVILGKLKTRTIAILAFIGIASFYGAKANAEDLLSSLRWKKRVLVVSALRPDNLSLTRQRQIFTDAQKAMTERDVVLVEAVGSTDTAQEIRKKLSIAPGEFWALLIGKDGHVALSSQTELSASYLTQVIDAMPMRRDEMRLRIA